MTKLRRSIFRLHSSVFVLGNSSSNGCLTPVFFAVVVLVGEEISATSVSHIQVANMGIATAHLGSAFVIRIGEEYCAIKVG